MSTHCSILAWRIPRTEDSGATVHGVTRIGHDLVTKQQQINMYLHRWVFCDQKFIATIVFLVRSCHSRGAIQLKLKIWQETLQGFSHRSYHGSTKEDTGPPASCSCFHFPKLLCAALCLAGVPATNTGLKSIGRHRLTMCIYICMIFE